MEHTRTIAPPESAERFVVVIEPHFALFRYPQVIHRKGYRSLVLASDPEATLAAEQRNNASMGIAGESRIDLVVPYASFRAEDLLAALAPYRDRIAGVVAGDDVVVPMAAEIGVALGFDYARPEDAQCHHVKTAMKQRLAERGVPTPAFEVAQSFEQAESAWERFGRDCMIKMVDFSGSLNVFRVQTREQLREAWETIVHNRRGLEVFFELAREVILEEFVGGRELTAEGYVQGDRVEVLNFSEKLTQDFNVVGHYIPALVTAEEERQLSEIAAQCVRALGLRNSVFHVEVHIQEGIPYVIECAARVPGGHAVELIEKSYGIDLMDINIDLATGREVRVTRRPPREHHALLAIYAEDSGVLQRIDGLEELRQRGEVLHLRLNIHPGERVKALKTDQKRYGMIMLGSGSPQAVRETASWVREHVRMVVAPV